MHSGRVACYLGGFVWSLTGWVRHTLDQPGAVVIGGFGDPTPDGCDCLVLADDRLELWMSGRARLQGGAVLPAVSADGCDIFACGPRSDTAPQS